MSTVNLMQAFTNTGLPSPPPMITVTVLPPEGQVAIVTSITLKAFGITGVSVVAFISNAAVSHFCITELVYVIPVCRMA